MNIFRKIFFYTFLLMAVNYLNSCAPKAQNDCGFVQNIFGQRISWKTKSPIKVIVHSSVPTNLRAAILRAAATWDKQVGHKVIEISEESSLLTTSPSKDQKNGIYFLSEWESDRSSEQGRTSVYWVGDQIQEADIRINAFNFSYYDQADPQQLVGSYGAKKAGLTATDGYSFEALLLHEMGHLLGLKHRDGATVMATHLMAFNDRIQPSATDQQSVSCEYK
jgi:hypothetical protein